MINVDAFVALSSAGEQSLNTIVLPHIDLVVPLEIDLDDDPDAEDEVRLRSDDGSYEVKLKAGDPDVNQDGKNSLLFYHFRNVPSGVYSVEVKILEAWSIILSGLIVAKGGVFVGGRSFEGSITGAELGTPEDEVDESSDDGVPEEEAETMECLG